jgi:hypothetical protein
LASFELALSRKNAKFFLLQLYNTHIPSLSEREGRRELGFAPRGIGIVLAVSTNHKVMAIGAVQAKHIHNDRAFCGVDDLPES